MSLKLTNELVKYRNAELTCLGIAPHLYHNACRLLDRHINAVYKGEVLHFFVNDNYPSLIEDEEVRNNPFFPGTKVRVDRRFEFEKAVDLLCESFGISTDMSYKILDEWRRYKIIQNNMLKEPVKYWRYLSIPNKPGEG